MRFIFVNEESRKLVNDYKERKNYNILLEIAATQRRLFENDPWILKAKAKSQSVYL